MREVAELAGVSVQTVSNLVNGRNQYMTEGTAKRVEAAMRKLNYHPNLTARSLRSAETRTLGFLVLDEHARFLADPLTDLVMAGIGDVAREEGYAILIQASRPSEPPERLLKPILESRADGAFLLLSGDRKIREAHIARAAEATAEFLVFDEPIADPGIMSVAAADRAGGRMITRHLIDAGHTRIGFIGPKVPWCVVEKRLAGFNDAMRAQGLTVNRDFVRMEAGWEPSSAMRIAEDLLTSRERPTAIICSSDLIAIATTSVASRLGLDVPGDVAVTGFDDFLFAAFARPALTTVRIPAYDMGREGARILISHIKNAAQSDADALQVEFPVELVIRESA